MSDFQKQLTKVGARNTARVRRQLVEVTQEVQRSVVEGSELTGAPGQPVDTGTLRASWVGRFVDRARWELSTNVEYAPHIENGGNARGPFTLRSAVGGFHSVKLTRASWGKIVATVAARVTGSFRKGRFA
jgi:hypothetical protein